MWTEVNIGGKVVDWFAPERPIGALLCLHDRDGRTLPNYHPSPASRFAIACPRGGEGWWTDRIWPGFDEKMSVERWLLSVLVPELKLRWPDVPLAIAGVGMGGLGALRIAFKHPEVFPIITALDAAVDCHDLYHEGTPLDEIYSSREHCRQDSPVLHISPVQQPRHICFAWNRNGRWERGNDRLHEKLTALGIAHSTATTEHEPGVKSILDFVENAFLTESRRLI